MAGGLLCSMVAAARREGQSRGEGVSEGGKARESRPGKPGKSSTRTCNGDVASYHPSKLNDHKGNDNI